MADNRKPDPFATDDDNPEWTDVDLARARPASRVLADHGLEVPRPRGRPKLDKPKIAVSLRLDRDVIDRFKAGGRGWQTRINEALREKAGLD